jgi:hypothetical protein
LCRTSHTHVSLSLLVICCDEQQVEHNVPSYAIVTQH